MSPAQYLELARTSLNVPMPRNAPSLRALHRSFSDTVPETSLAYFMQTPGDDVGALPMDRDFVAMLSAYRPTGGIARTSELNRLLNQHRPGGAASISVRGLIDSGQLFGFEWRRTFWVPLFQFDLTHMSIKLTPRQVVAELASDFDGWALAVWFAQPNSWLHQRRPVDLLDWDLKRVLEAARTDRFIATG